MWYIVMKTNRQLYHYQLKWILTILIAEILVLIAEMVVALAITWIVAIISAACQRTAIACQSANEGPLRSFRM